VRRRRRQTAKYPIAINVSKKRGYFKMDLFRYSFDMELAEDDIKSANCDTFFQNSCRAGKQPG
jgi:hypothetical protein